MIARLETAGIGVCGDRLTRCPPGCGDRIQAAMTASNRSLLELPRWLHVVKSGDLPINRQIAGAACSRAPRPLDSR